MCRLDTTKKLPNYIKCQKDYRMGNIEKGLTKKSALDAIKEADEERIKLKKLAKQYFCPRQKTLRSQTTRFWWSV